MLEIGEGKMWICAGAEIARVEVVDEMKTMMQEKQRRQS
jgi:hypothetical protein